MKENKGIIMIKSIKTNSEVETIKDMLNKEIDLFDKESKAEFNKMLAKNKKIK